MIPYFLFRVGAGDGSTPVATEGPILCSAADNRVLTGTLSATSEDMSAPVTNLADDIGATPWQTQSGITTASFDIDAGSAVAFRIFAIFRTNFTETAVVRFTLGSTQGAANIADSGNLTGITAGYLQLVWDAGADLSARWCRVTIVDPTNPDDRLSVGLAYAGPVTWAPSRGISPTTTEDREDSTPTTVTKGGQEYPQNDWQRRAWSIEIINVTEAEAKGQLWEIDRIARQGGNALFVPFLDSSYIQREAIFGILKGSSLSFPSKGRDWRSWRGRITERL